MFGLLASFVNNEEAEPWKSVTHSFVTTCHALSVTACQIMQELTDTVSEISGKDLCIKKCKEFPRGKFSF